MILVDFKLLETSLKLFDQKKFESTIKSIKMVNLKITNMHLCLNPKTLAK